MMRTYDKNKPLVSIHIPKCGGTSMKEVLRSWYGNRLVMNYHNQRLNTKPTPVRLKNWWNGSFKKDICIHGHFNRLESNGLEHLYPQVDQFITFLRDPLEIQISLFHYLNKLEVAGENYRKGSKRQAPKSIDRFIENNGSIMLHHLPFGITEQNYKEQIELRFVHIGFIDTYQNSINILAEKLNKPRVSVPRDNVSERLVKPTESAIAKFKENSKLEYLIYNYAIELFHK